MARVLNRNGCYTGQGNRWTQARVASARRKYVITGRPHRLPDPEVLTLRQAALYCGVSPTVIKRLVQSGLLKRDQVARWAPWEIRRADLDSAPIHQALAQLHTTGRLPPAMDAERAQQSLFQ
ncbi:MAG: helix-turn-helix domain-containing protein [Alphaproteobacteria bacterium]|nr:helix-turn-helix domain-containing protein [Alphaproteobacteria bacterium]